MHLQDVDMSSRAPAPSPEGAPTARPRARYPQVALGQGSIDWVKTFKAAKVGGVKNYFVELEEDPALMPLSVPYLKSLSV